MRSSRESAVGSDSVVLEIGAGEGALTERLAACAAHVHAVEIDSRLRERLTDVSRLANVSLHWEDAMRLELADLRPPPEAMVSNLPYSIATPMILRTIAELPGLGSWTLMVQREIADRLRAAAGLPPLRGVRACWPRSPPRCGCCGRSTRRCSSRGRGSSRR